MDSFGPASKVASCVELPDPTPPGHDEIVVDVAAFPINPADLLTIEGKYAAKPPLPYTPGAEAVGHVSEVGSAIDNFRIGDLVMLLSRENCGFMGFFVGSRETMCLTNPGDSIPWFHVKQRRPGAVFGYSFSTIAWA